MSSCHWKTLVTFCLRKKRAENSLLTSTENYRKIVQKNKIMSFKTTVNDIYLICYLAIASFD